MTKSEAIAQFTEIIKSPEQSLEAAANFINSLSEDYDKFDATETTIKNVNDQIITLKNENNKLKETNLQLFTMFPSVKDAVIDISKPQENNPPVPPETDSEYTPDQIALMLMGKDNK